MPVEQDSLLSPVRLAQTRDPRKQSLFVLQRIREHHEQSAYHTKVSEEE